MYLVPMAYILDGVMTYFDMLGLTSKVTYFDHEHRHISAQFHNSTVYLVAMTFLTAERHILTYLGLTSKVR